ncbi:Uncharacterised protein [Serratia fonticola]|uniref:Uncharacterized protein n=1 Tax=Serratia fonticola TaxID=47917 RepID=A0A4U9TR53_SERFO|nr:Uncharacterised protein [Serratia fonticola]
MLHNTNGGSSDTELKLLAVTPTRVPSAVAAVTTVTRWRSCPAHAGMRVDPEQVLCDVSLNRFSCSLYHRRIGF